MKKDPSLLLSRTASLLLLGFSIAPSVFATDPPHLAIYNTNALPTNAVIASAAPLPMMPGFSLPVIESPGVSTNFSGLDDNVTLSPPDTEGAVGKSNVVTMLNTEVRIQRRDGTVISTTSLANWWSGAGTFSFIFDPHILYDPYQDRWIP